MGQGIPRACRLRRAGITMAWIDETDLGSDKVCRGPIQRIPVGMSRCPPGFAEFFLIQRRYQGWDQQGAGYHSGLAAMRQGAVSDCR